MLDAAASLGRGERGSSCARHAAEVVADRKEVDRWSDRQLSTECRYFVCGMGLPPYLVSMTRCDEKAAARI
jgi:hypothetical protein